MEKDLKRTFINIMNYENMKYVNEKSIKYKKTFRFASILNIEDSYDIFFKQKKKMYTIQKCIRTTDKILNIAGNEGVASPFTYMMSFFLTKEKNLEYAINLTFDIFNQMEIDVDNIIIITSDNMFHEIRSYLPVKQRVCIISREKLHSTLDSEGLDGEYIKFYFKNFNGFVPVGTLNIIQRENIYVVDSSFLLECDVVASYYANSIFNTDIFLNSFKVISKWENTIPKRLKYKILCLGRLILICMYNGIYPGSKGRSYTVRKLIRNLVIDVYISTYTADKFAYSRIINTYISDLVDGLSEDLTLFEVNLDIEKNESIKKIIISEVESYIKLLINSKKIINNSNYDRKRLTEEKGIPIKLLNYYENNAKTKNNQEYTSKNTPMNPLFEDIDRKTIEWIREIHGE